MPPSFWILVFFIGWPLSGGSGATISKINGPSLSPGRDGRLTKESIRDTKDIHREPVSEVENVEQLEGIVEHLDEIQEDGNIKGLECLQVELADNDHVNSTINQEEKGPGVVQKMVLKFSKHGPKQVPFLTRRNTVARCTNIVNDVKQGKHDLLRRNIESQHVVWDYNVTGADAATDLEFSLLMERMNVLNTASYDKTRAKKDTTEGSSSLNRQSSSRKSLPAGALKSYMRGTKVSVLKTREGSIPPSIEEEDRSELRRNLPSRGSPSSSGRMNKASHLQQPSLQSKIATSIRSDSIMKSGRSCPEGNETVQRKRTVTVKPSIPPVLLKGTSKAITEESTTAILALNRDKAWSTPQRHLLGGQCEEKCNHCLLVDLWFTIWHVEFNKK